jgi:serine protease AprX
VRTTARLLAAVLTASATAALPAPAVEGAVLERWVVSFDALPDDLGDLLATAGVVDGVALHTVDAIAVTLPAAGVDRLVSRTDVLGARPERRLRFGLARSVPFIGADRAQLGSSAEVGPAGGPSITRPPVDGTGQTVAIVDTGVFAQHPDLLGQVVASLDFELAYAGELLLTPEQLDTFVTATGPVGGLTDDIGHGTHVAGIVAGTGAAAQGRANENRGVAPGASLVDVRISPQAHVTDNNLGWERNALAAYDWLVRHHADTSFGPSGITVLNNSWGTGDSTVTGEPLDYEPFAQLLDLLDAAGVSVVFSAGNSGPSDDVTESLLPTGHPTVITVAAGCTLGTSSSGCAASKPDLRIASFSSHGDAVDVTAPGVDIVSAINPSSGWALGKLSGDFSGASTTDRVVNTAAYASFSGTSMSGPHVAGAVALLREAGPDLTPAQLRSIVAATARDILEPGRDRASGWGVVDTPAALAAVARLRAGIPLEEQFPGFVYAPTR